MQMTRVPLLSMLLELARAKTTPCGKIVLDISLWHFQNGFRMAQETFMIQTCRKRNGALGIGDGMFYNGATEGSYGILVPAIGF